jgi:Rod binding domain-containing protein
MDLTAIQSNVSAANVPLDELAGNRALTQRQKVAEVAQQFEAVMLQQILQETQKPVFKTEFTDNSTAASIYRSLISKQLAEAMSKSGNFGLAKMLEKQLTKQLEISSSKSGHHPSAETPAETSEVVPAKPGVVQPFKFTATQPK